MKIIIFGPPCAGKTTIAHLLAESLGIIHISFQQLCQEEFQRGTSKGKRWDYYMDNGLPFDKLLANSIVAPVFQSQQEFIIEGYPKKRHEVGYFYKANGKADITAVLRAEVSCLSERMQGRRICKECELPFSMNISKFCPQCGSSGDRRPDDNLEKFTWRLKEYSENAKQSIPALRKISKKFLEIKVDDISTREIAQFLSAS